ncbi:sorting nexin 2B-like [Papaver somniferum]|uniref:sorting nexin 2B-like n=1 Tax=Papaver somniferum TaxID=3469 RepID=UPI000E703DA0|nr:sorting nexin 2B-like [Papaver somniferum]
MMGSENQNNQSSNLNDSMENLILNDDVDVNGSSSPSSSLLYKSAMESSVLSDSHHPLSPSSSSSLGVKNNSSNRKPNSDFISHPLKEEEDEKKNLKNPILFDNLDLEPPSYADVVYSPFTNQNGGGDSDFNVGGSMIGSSSRQDSPGESFRNLSRAGSINLNTNYLKISVSNPQNETETTNSLVPGGGSYVTYQINTTTNLPEYRGSEFSVRRRFRDVVTLSDRLADGYRGYLIPPRPDKSVVESRVMEKEEFMEQRRVALEKYLCRLAAHPVIRKSDELRVFLQVQGKLPLLTSTDVASRMLEGAVNLPRQLFSDTTPVVAPNEVSQSAKGGRDLLRMFKELKQSVTNDWGGSKPPVVEEDKEFLEKKEKLRDFEQQLSNVSKQAEGLVKAQQDIGETMGELGLAFVKLTKFENERAVYNCQRTRAADMKCVATAAVKASRYYRELNSHTVKHLDTLHEYLGMMLAVDSAFSDRTSALLTVQTVISELSSLHLRAEKLEAASSKIFGGDKSRIRKVEELKETIRVTEDAKMVAVREYERIKENNRSELERLDKERHDDFLSMIKGFVMNQVGYAEKIANVWEKVAEETSVYAKESS